MQHSKSDEEGYEQERRSIQSSLFRANNFSRSVTGDEHFGFAEATEPTSKGHSGNYWMLTKGAKNMTHYDKSKQYSDAHFENKLLCHTTEMKTKYEDFNVK